MKFEYKAVEDIFTHELAKSLNVLGKQGWELVSVCYTNGSSYAAFLKRTRPIRPSQDVPVVPREV